MKVFFTPPIPSGHFTRRIVRLLILTAVWLMVAAPCGFAQTRILCIGDSITNGGGGGYGPNNGGGASWRYPLYFQLVDNGYNVNFVGTQNGYFITPPNALDYPRIGNFDPDHDGYWGAPTSHVLSIIDNIAASTQPNIALIHLGTNDIGTSYPPNPSGASNNLQNIIGRLRAQNPNIKILIAQIIPTDPEISANFDHTQIPVLNSMIMNFAASLHTATSPIVVVDQYSGFDCNTLTKDGAHPNIPGEVRMGQTWFAALKKVLDEPTPIQPVIAHQPQGKIVSSGANVTLSVAAAGHAPITYQWKRNNTNVSNATSPVLNLNAITAGEAGDYTCVVTTPQGSVTSSVATLTVGTAVPLIMQGATWKYLDNGSNQGTAWRARTFNDSSWLSGGAQLGYGDGDEVTRIEDNPTPGYTGGATDRYITTYFRRHFNVTNPADYSALRLRILRDDGAVVYLNGVEVFRTNMPGLPGEINHLTTAKGGGTSEVTFFEPYNQPSTSLLVSGDNVIAVEVHQASADSSDISFDFELSATGNVSSTLDSDGDGYTDYFESKFGTNPNDPNSRLLITSRFRSSGKRAVTFVSSPGTTYQMQYTDSLGPTAAATVWNTVTLELDGGTTGTSYTAVVNIDPVDNLNKTQLTDHTAPASLPARRFYRIIAQ